MPWIEPVDRFAAEPRLPKRPPRTSPWDGEVEDGTRARLDTVAIDAQAIDASPYGALELLDCALTGVTLKTSDRSTVRLVDCVLENCDLSQATVEELRGCRFVGCKFAGTDFSNAVVRDCAFERCALQYANLRVSTLERVSFVDCRFDDVDAQEARLTDVTMAATALQELNVDRMRCERLDLRGAASLGLTGVTSLRGCLLGDAEVQQLAYTLALAADAMIERSS